MSEKEALLNIDLCGAELAFFTVDDVETWVKKELAFWQWPDGFARRAPQGWNPGQVVDSLRSSLSDILSSVTQLKRESDENRRDQFVSELRRKFANAYKIRSDGCLTLLCSTEPRAQFVHDLIAADPIRAAFTAGYFMRANLNIEHPAVLDGAVTGILFDLGIKGTCEAEKAALEQLRREWRELTANAQQAKESNAAAARTWRAQVESDREQYQAAQKEMLDKAQADLDDFKKRISAEIALKGPVTYWQEKETDHIRQSRRFFWATVSAFVLVGIGVGVMIEYFGPNVTLDHIKLGHIGLLAVGATTGVWFIRMLVRNYFSHVHLLHDAGERVAMMKTYLALLEEGKLADKHRNLILQALFRPASTGIVKDDAAPPFMAEWLKRTTGTDAT